MQKNNFKPFPVLTTENLILRQLRDDDENEIFAIRSDLNVAKYLDRPLCKTIEEARLFIKKINEGIDANECIYWAITYKDNTRVIGTICLWNILPELSKADIGYELSPDSQGKGIMQEALAATLKYGFEMMQLNSIDAELDPENLKSVKLLERNHFVISKKTIEDSSVDTQAQKTVLYKLFK